jgi:Putative Ig domain
MRRTMLEIGRTLGVVLLLVLLVSGCSGREEPSASKSPNPGARQAARTPAERHPASGTGSFSVSILPKQPTASEDLRLVVSGTDTIGPCSWERNGEPVETSDSSCLLRKNFVKGDEIRVRVSVGGQEASADVAIVNAPPEVVAVTFRDPAIHRGVDIEVIPEGADIDGDPVQFRYVWALNGETLPLDSPVLPGDQFNKGDHISLSVIPFDGESEGREYRGREFVIPNAPPSFTSTPPLKFKSGVYRYQAVAEDADGDAIHFRLESAPEGMSIDSDTGLVVWPVAKDQRGEHTITIVAEDEDGAKAFQTYTVTISLED